MKGWTTLPNFIWDRADLTVYERVVLVHIVRKTMGWGKVTDGISYGQFVDALGVSKSSVMRAIEGLITKKMINKKSQKNNRGGHGFNLYSLTKKLVNQADNSGMPETPPPVSERDKGSISEKQPLVSERDIQETLVQETLLQERGGDVGSYSGDPNRTLPQPNSELSKVPDDFMVTEETLSKIRLSGVVRDEEWFVDQMELFKLKLENKLARNWQKEFHVWCIRAKGFEGNKNGGFKKGSGSATDNHASVTKAAYD